MQRSPLVLLALLVIPGLAEAQPVSDTLRTDSSEVYESLERILDERISDAQTSTQTAEILSRLVDNPLDLNRASPSELSTIPAFSPALARRIVRYRRAEGPFDRVADLTDVDRIDVATVRAIHPYVRVDRTAIEDTEQPPSYPSVPSAEQILTNLKIDLIQRMTRELDLGRGYEQDTTRTSFQGSPERLTTRIRLGYKRRLQFALTLDKDPGEPFRWAPGTNTYGFDHVAGNVALRDWGRLETLILGDFTAQYGQGVALWQGLTFGKGRSPVSPLVREGRGLVPFQSTSENRFFRGAAARVAISPRMSASGFVSRRHRDATLDSTGTSSSPIPARTLSIGGRHRTASELRRKGTFGKTTVGGAVEYHASSVHVGVTGYQSWFDRPLRPPTDRPDERFAVAGRRTSMVSTYANAYLDEYTLFGEVARTPDGVYGGVLGAAFDHEAGVQALLMGRQFPRAFRGLYNSAIGESGSTQNERGVYTGLRLQVAERWRIGAYVDQYRFPWLRFNVPRPSSGLDTRLVVEYDPRPWLSTYVQVRAEREEASTTERGPGGRQLGGLQTEHRQSARWHTEYQFSDALTVRTRIQLSRFSTSTEPAAYGVLLSQGFRLQPFESLQIDTRLAFFDTDGYESRIYAYEHDLLYSFSVPVLFDRGQRSYVLAQYEPFSSLTIEAKYGVTWYPHRRTVGSGLNETDGNRSRELRLQVRWQY
jgi:DNA uptake protein ComE-like DNA-binding protein